MNTPTPEKEKLTRVYNRGTRTFIHGEHKSVGASFADVPESVATRWMKLFPNDVVEAGVAQKELGGLGAQLAEVREQLTTTTAELAATKQKLAAIKSDPRGDAVRTELAAARERIKQLEADLEKATAPAPDAPSDQV